MGDYIYVRRSPKLCKTVEVKHKDGGVIKMTVASMSFLFKPYGLGNEEFNAPYWRAVDRLNKIWKDSGVPIPQYAAITDPNKGHKIEVGQEVYGFRTRISKEALDGVPDCYNDGIESWYCVGEVIKVF